MRTFHKLVVALGLASMLSLGVIWGTGAASSHTVRAVAEDIQKPGHGALAWQPQDIQKPGH
jgi:hypothetical protein